MVSPELIMMSLRVLFTVWTTDIRGVWGDCENGISLGSAIDLEKQCGGKRACIFNKLPR